MATLLELELIETNSTGDPASVDPDVIAAISLRKKFRYAVLKRANVILNTPLPTGDGERNPALELLAWAQRAVASPDQAISAVFRLTLAANSAASAAAILAATDQTVEDAIAPVLPLLAKGLFPGR
jgi:hypothetical protein